MIEGAIISWHFDNIIKNFFYYVCDGWVKFSRNNSKGPILRSILRKFDVNIVHRTFKSYFLVFRSINVISVLKLSKLWEKWSFSICNQAWAFLYANLNLVSVLWPFSLCKEKEPTIDRFEQRPINARFENRVYNGKFHDNVCIICKCCERLSNSIKIRFIYNLIIGP